MTLIIASSFSGKSVDTDSLDETKSNESIKIEKVRKKWNKFKKVMNAIKFKFTIIYI